MKPLILTALAFVSVIALLALIMSVETEPTYAQSSCATGGYSWSAQNVQLVDQLGGASDAVVIRNQYAYIGEGARLTILNISNPVNPVPVGKTGILPYIVQDVAVIGNYAYVADGAGGLRVIDISNPVNPVEIGFSTSSTRAASRIAIDGNYAYVEDVCGIRIFDISNPSQPTQVASYTINTFPSVDTGDVAVNGNYAYVVGESYFSGGYLRVLDVSDPLHPSQVGSLSNCSCKSITIVGNYAYIVGGGMTIVSIADPTNPTIVGTFNLGLYGPSVGIGISEPYAYVTQANTGLHVIDISNPAQPTQVGFYQEYTSYSNSLAIAGSYAYVANGEYGFSVLDVSDPLHPSLVATYAIPSQPILVAAATPYLPVGDLGNGQGSFLRIINISDPLHLASLGYIGCGIDDLAAAGSFAYCISSMPYQGYDGPNMQIVDISNPTQPIARGNLHTNYNDEVWGIAVAGSYAYLSTTSSGQGRGHVVVSGNYAYLLGDGLRVVDISNPDNPTEVGSSQTTASPAFRVFDVSNPNSPRQVGYLDLGMANESSTSIAISGSVVYGLIGDHLLHIISVSNPASPARWVYTTTMTGLGPPMLQ